MNNIKQKTVGLIALTVLLFGTLVLGGTSVEASEKTESITIETKDSVKMVGLKEVFSSIGGTVKTIGETNETIQAQYEDKLIEFSIGSEYVMVNGVYETFTTKDTKDSAVLPQYSDGAIAESQEIFVPVEFLERVFDFDSEKDTLVVPKVEEKIEEVKKEEVEVKEEVEINDSTNESAVESSEEVDSESEVANSESTSTENDSSESTNESSQKESVKTETVESTKPAVEKEPVKEVVETPKVETPKPVAPKPTTPVVKPKPVAPVAPSVTIDKVRSLLNGGGYNIEIGEYDEGIEVIYTVEIGSANQNIPETYGPAMKFVKGKLSGAGVVYSVYDGGSFFVIDIPK